MAELRSTSDANVFQVAGYGLVDARTWRVGQYYDTVSIRAGLIPAGKQFTFFRDVTGKNLNDNNLENNAGRIEAQSEIIINRVGGFIAQAVGDTLPTDADAIKLGQGFLNVTVNKTRTIFQAPLDTAQSGYGFTGTTTRTNTGVVTIGTASAAAAPQLLIAQPISGLKDQVVGFLTYFDSDWMNVPAVGAYAAVTYVPPTLVATNKVRIYLDGLINTALNP